MPKSSSRILSTDREIRAATSLKRRTDFRIKGAPALQLRVTERGGKTWALAYKSPLTGKWTKAAIGTYPEIGLAEAKDRAQELAVEIRRGKDPVHDKRRQALLESFDDLAQRYMQEHCARNARNGQHSRSSIDAQRILDKDILPTLGPMRAEVITRAHVMQVVEPIAERGALRAADVALTLVRSIFNWACATGRLDRNPTLGLKKRNASKPRVRVLRTEEIRIFWNAIEDMPLVSASIRDALRLQLLTALRINEVTEAFRGEIDFEKKLWIIPAHRTKSEREHILPLSDMALDLIRKIVARTDHEAERRARRHGSAFQKPELLFPSRSRNSQVIRMKRPKWERRVPGALDPHAASRCLIRCRDTLRKMGIKERFNTHDLRRTAATHLGEMSIADDIIERILNHAPRTIAGKHYNHARYLIPMREALDGWAEKVALMVADSNEQSGTHARARA